MTKNNFDDPTQIEALWREYRAGIKAFLLANVANHADVDELLQDILIKTFKSVGSVKDGAKVKSWLFQVANNTIIDFYRKRARDKGLSEEDLWYGDDSPNIHRELSKCLVPFIQALPADEADMLMAIELHGQSQKDYAAEHGISYSTLKSRVQKSRGNLYRLYKGCCVMSLDSKGGLAGCDLKEDSPIKC